MKLFIDNHELIGPREYTESLDAANPPRVIRTLNRPARMQAAIIGEIGAFTVPMCGSLISLERSDGSKWVSGQITSAPEQEFVGMGLRGALVRYRLNAISDECELDAAPLDGGVAIAQSSAVDVLRRWTESAGSGEFDTSDLEDVGTIAAITVSTGERWSEAARRLAAACRAAYTAEEGKVSLKPIGEKVHELDDTDSRFRPDALKVEQSSNAVADWTVIGEIGPSMYVKDYFVGDGHTLRFPMSQQPFLRPSVTWLEEEYAEEISPAIWQLTNLAAIAVSNGKLVVDGGAGQDGSAVLCAVEALELGGCMVLEHGSVVVNAASDAVIGGLYDGTVSIGSCVAGFRLSSAGANTNLRPLVDGTAVGTSVGVQYGHRYELTTRLYATEVFRIPQAFRWSGGGEEDSPHDADVRFVMEMRDLDGSTPIPAATVLYEGVVSSAPALVKYAIVNATSCHATIAYTRIRRTPTAEVRTISAADGSTRTRIVGGLADGAECSITTGPAVYFYSPFKPANGDQIIVRYRAANRTATRVADPMANGNGAAVVKVAAPTARTQADCERAATALLRESAATGWKGKYETWTDLLPSGEIYPGDSIHLNASSRELDFTAIVREVETELADGANDRARYTLKFANESSEPVGIECERFTAMLSGAVRSVEPGQTYPDEMPRAEAVTITSTSVQVDAGTDLANGCGIEVRREGDFGWGAGNDRNLVGRFTTRNFTVPRSTRAEDYYLRMYDGSSPARYSPLTTLLHVDVKDESI